MTRRIPPAVRQAEAQLSLLDKRAVILAWQAYQLEMHGLPPEVFGEAFDEYLDTALSSGDRLGVLTHGVHDVIMDLREIAEDDEDEWPILRDCLAAALPEEVFLTVMGSIEPNV